MVTLRMFSINRGLTYQDHASIAASLGKKLVKW